MNNLLIPFIFVLYVIAGVALADPYQAFDYETEEYVTVYPQGDDVVIEVNEELEMTPKVVVDETPDQVWVVDPDSGDVEVYLKTE